MAEVNAVINQYRGNPPRQWGIARAEQFNELPGNDAPAEFYEAFDRINAEVCGGQLQRINIRVDTPKFNSGFVSWRGAGTDPAGEFIGFWETFPNDKQYMFDQMARHMAYVTRRREPSQVAPSTFDPFGWLFGPARTPSTVEASANASTEIETLMYLGAVEVEAAPRVHTYDQTLPAALPAAHWMNDLRPAALAARPDVEGLLRTAIEALANAKAPPPARRTRAAPPPAAIAAPSPANDPGMPANDPGMAMIAGMLGGMMGAQRGAGLPMEALAQAMAAMTGARPMVDITPSSRSVGLLAAPVVEVAANFAPSNSTARGPRVPAGWRR